jgi:TRAP-type C4-dicarboxylate transport system permease small subunit
VAEEVLNNEADSWEQHLRQEKPWRYLVVLPSWFAAAALFIMMVMTFADVLLRSTINDPIEWATELTRIFMVVIVFCSLPVVSWRSTHIIVDLMDPLFSRRMANIRDIVIDLICGVVLFWPAWRVYEMAERSRGYGDVTEYMHWPQHYSTWFVAAFTLITAVTLVVRGLVRIFAPHRISA